MDYLPDKVSRGEPLKAGDRNKLLAEVSRLTKLASGGNVISNGAGIFPKYVPGLKIIEGTLATALGPSSDAGNTPSSATLNVLFSDGASFSGVGRTETIVNRNDKFAAAAGDYIQAVWLSPEWRPLPYGNGSLYRSGGGDPCNHFNCTWDSIIMDGETGANCTPSAYIWYFPQFPLGLCSGEQIGGAPLTYVSGCTWQSPLVTNPRTGNTVQDTLTIDMNGMCVLSMAVNGTDVITYRIPGDKWCPLCVNTMYGCGPTDCTGMPRTVCIQPFQHGPPPCPICPNTAAWVVTASGFGGSSCCDRFNGTFVVEAEQNPAAPGYPCRWIGGYTHTTGDHCFDCTGLPGFLGGYTTTLSVVFLIALDGGGHPTFTVSFDLSQSCQGVGTVFSAAGTYILDPATCAGLNTLLSSGGIGETFPSSIPGSCGNGSVTIQAL